MDLAASLRSVVKVPNTFRELALKLLHEIPRRYAVIYIACDTYACRSIKNAERLLRGDKETEKKEVLTFAYLQTSLGSSAMERINSDSLK